MHKKTLATDLAYVAVFTALVITMAFISIPGAAGVPIVVQNAMLVLTGLILGGRRGLYVGLLFFFLGLALPVLASGATVLKALSGPTAGYLIGYIFSPSIAGIIAYRCPRHKGGMTIAFIIAAIAAALTQYICGAFGLMLRSGMNATAAFEAQLAFIPLDSLKLAVAIAIALTVHAAFPDLMGRKPHA